MNRSRPEVLVLALAVFLAVIGGGQPLLESFSGGGPLGIFLGDAALIRTHRALLGLLVFGGIAWMIYRDRALSTPRPIIQLALIGTVAFPAFSMMAGRYRAAGVDELLNLILCAGCLLLAGLAAGRKSGPWIIVGAAVAGAGIVGLRGLFEYLSIRSVEPTYRIFAGWSNPNAVAGLYLACLPAALALSVSDRRSARIVGLIAGPMCLCGLLLTQSKGGLLAGVIGLVAFAVVAAIWLRPKLPTWGAWAALLALGGGLFGFTQFAPVDSNAAAGPGLNRIVGATGEAEQSGGFRLLLWQTSVRLIAEQPWGWGPGSFRFISAKPGLVTQTVTAHQNWLQTAVEGGLAALISLLILAGAWFKCAFTGARAMTDEQNLLRAGIVASVVAIGAHGFIESSFAYLGMGVLTFTLLGIGLQVSSDGLSPEPRN
ncbi:MAG: O-antigen ligase family protein, partial [Fimbriimonadaceae bacterium]|nr:O-antigen ligase family protein [Fimbriimonadaceae bacterium]